MTYYSAGYRAVLLVPVFEFFNCHLARLYRIHFTQVRRQGGRPR
jgi:hypothetical protein